MPKRKCGQMNWCISRFLKKTGGGCSVIHTDHYFVLRIEDSQILCNIRSWRSVNLLYEVKFCRRKPHRLKEKLKKASCCRRFVCISRGQTQPHILMNELYFCIIEMIYKKKNPCLRTKCEWTVVNLLVLFAVLKSVEIWAMKILVSYDAQFYPRKSGIRTSIC